MESIKKEKGYTPVVVEVGMLFGGAHTEIGSVINTTDGEAQYLTACNRVRKATDKEVADWNEKVSAFEDKEKAKTAKKEEKKDK